MKISIKYYPQYKDYSCGPVSLKMIFEHLGIKYSREKLIKLCNCKPHKGTNQQDLINEVKNEGLKYISNKNGKIETLIKFLENGYPIIVNYYNPISKCGHYSIIIGYEKKEKILIFADSANGNDFCLSYNEFKKLWHNNNSTSKGWYLVIGRENIII